MVQLMAQVPRNTNVQTSMSAFSILVYGMTYSNQSEGEYQVI